jgi:hypothetical protein
MKLEFWDSKFNILRLNNRLPAKSKWPALEAIIDDCDANIDLRSTLDSTYNSGIFIGWAYKSTNILTRWYYHHAICLSYRTTQLFGYTSNESSIAKEKRIFPVYNLGNLPESEAFVKILQKHNIKASIYDHTMKIPELV